MVLGALVAVAVVIPLAALAASGRALVVTDVPGNRHFVRDGIEGLTVPPGDVSALAAALHRMANDRELRLSLGAAARQRLLQGFTEEHVRAAVRASYTRLLGGEGCARTPEPT